MECSKNSNYWQTIHNLCLESKPASENLASWNKSCCAQIQSSCNDPGAVLSECGVDAGKKPTMAMEYKDNQLVYNKKHVSGGVGIL